MINDTEVETEITLAAVEAAIARLRDGIDAAIDRFERDVRLGHLEAEKARLEATLGCLCHPTEGGDR